MRARLARPGATSPPAALRLRLLVSRDGEISLTSRPLSRPRTVGIGLARLPVDSADPFLYHKTTHRRVYAEALATRPDCDEVLLWNERGELTEATIANVVVRFGNDLVTPPVRCGLLPGVMRARLLAGGRIRERVVTVDELSDCDGLYLVNSVTWARPDLHPGLPPLRLRDPLTPPG